MSRWLSKAFRSSNRFSSPPFIQIRHEITPASMHIPRTFFPWFADAGEEEHYIGSCAAIAAMAAVPA